MFLWTVLMVVLALSAASADSGVPPYARFLLFPAMDTNGDGLVTFEELQVYFESIDSSEVAPREDRFRSVFIEMDRNNDTSLDLMEVASRVKHRFQGSEDEIRTMFKSMDEDQNNVLSFDELNKGEVSAFFKEELVRNLFRYLDVNQDAALTLQEFEELL